VFDGLIANPIEVVAEGVAAMRFGNLPFTTTNWGAVPTTEHAGAKGVAVWRTVQAGEVRVRMVEYSPGYMADHWCKRGHVLLVLEGELQTELNDGRIVRLAAGMSYQVADDVGAHRSSTPSGAKVFIVD
jgi:hypothetical protein